MDGAQQSVVTSLLDDSEVLSTLRTTGPQYGSSLEHELWSRLHGSESHFYHFLALQESELYKC